MNKIEKDILALIAEDSRLTAKKMAAMLGVEESKVMQRSEEHTSELQSPS